MRDRNRVTGAGVTSGIDFGLVLLALVAGEATANIKPVSYTHLDVYKRQYFISFDNPFVHNQ